MSTTCDIIEISEDFLELFKKHKKAIYLYYKASNYRNKISIGNLYKLSKKQKYLVRDICQLYPEEHQQIKQLWNFNDCTSVLQYQKFYPDEYRIVGDYIPKIIKQGKICHFLDIGSGWRLANSLFSGGRSIDINELLTWNQNFLGLNPIFYRKHILESDLSRYYLTVNEVKSIAKLIEDFGNAIICESLNSMAQKNKYFYWVSHHREKDEAWLSHALNLYYDIQDFYCKVAARKNTLVINIS